MQSWPHSHGYLPPRTSDNLLDGPRLPSPAPLAPLHAHQGFWQASGLLSATTPPPTARYQTLLCSPEGRPGSPQLAMFGAGMDGKHREHTHAALSRLQYCDQPDQYHPGARQGISGVDGLQAHEQHQLAMSPGLSPGLRLTPGKDILHSLSHAACPTWLCTACGCQSGATPRRSARHC